MARKQAIIIGAGPAGLTAAYYLLRETDIKPVVLEQENFVGGIARTAEHHGNRMDIGGHRFFTKNSEVMALWQELVPLLTRRRISRIYYLRRFFDYPITLGMTTIKNLGLGRLVAVAVSYLRSWLTKLPEDNLENFMINRFGRKLYQMFFRDYTHKVWGRYPSEIAASWGAQRIKGLSIASALKDLACRLLHISGAKETSLIDEFYYPEHGPGEMWEAMRERITARGGEVRLAAAVRRVVVRDGRAVGVVVARATGDATTASSSASALDGGLAPDEEFIAADYVISSMPLAELVPSLTGIVVPERVQDIATRLPYRDFMTVGLLVDRLAIVNNTHYKTPGNIIPDTWIYVQEADVDLGRLQVFNNWSPSMVADAEHTVWLGLEYFCREGDASWQMSDADFIEFAISELTKIGIIRGPEAVLDSVRLRVKKAYPAYFDSYADFPEVQAFLDGIAGLYCIGRNGQHRYNNMDHSMLTAIEAVRAIKSGTADRSRIWGVNTEESYHEVRHE